MKLEISLKRINELMSRFIVQIEGEAAMGRTDLNKAAETILIPLLNEVYGWNLKNVNHYEKNNNYPGVDLVDQQEKVCIQVTAAHTAKKIKDTLRQFKKHKQYLEYSRLIVLLLKKKQRTYPEKAIQEIIQDKFQFDTTADIWDYCTLLNEISSFSIDKISKIQNILESNFGDDRQSLRLGNDSRVQDRITRLKILQEKSKASCIASFKVVLGKRKLATDLAEDQSLGIPPASLRLKPGHLFILIGELGIGKTLIIQRLFQRLVESAIKDPNASIPIYVESEQLRNGKTLEEIIISKSSDLGDLTNQGATIFLDALEQVGARLAANILEEIYKLREMWPNTLFIVTSRPIRCLKNLEEHEKIWILPLSKSKSYELIEKVSGNKITAMNVSSWSDSVQEAICQPLFALIVGGYLQRDFTSPPRSTGELLSWLVEEALEKAKVDPDSCLNSLQQLARSSIESSNGRVYIADICGQNEWKALAEVGLVVEKVRGIISFPLQILTEWFAAKSLANDPSLIEDCVCDSERLENWRYPLAIAVAILSHNQASALLEPIAKKYPTFASEVIFMASSRWGSQERPLPSAKQCGKQIRQAMESWVAGLGNLSKMIAPVQQNGQLRTVGTRLVEKHLQVAWYRGSRALEPIVTLPSNWSDCDQRLQGIWIQGRSSAPSNEPAWAWRWALDTLISNLGRKLEFPVLNVDSEPLIREASWRAALAIVAHAKTKSFVARKWWGLEKIPLSELDETLTYIEDKASKNYWIVLSELGSRNEAQQNYYLQNLRQEINRLREMHQTYLHSPWIGPDQFQGRCLWELYSPQRLQERTQIVYEAALNIYQQIAENCFPTLRPGLQIASILPARLVGYLSPISEDNLVLGTKDIPRFDWFLEALPKNQNNATEIHLSENYLYEAERQRIATASQQLEHLRPQSAVWIGYLPYGANLSDKHFFGHSPATALAYSWLQRDLKKVFGIRHFPRSTYL